MAPTAARRSSRKPARPPARPQRSRSGNPSAAAIPPARVRLWLLALILMGGQLGLLARLVYLQVYQAPQLQRIAEGYQLVPLPPLVARYPIVDRRGDLLAADQPAFTLFAHPFLFNEPLPTVATKLTPLLKQPIDKIQQRLQTGRSGIPVAYDVSETTASQIRDLRLDGLELIREWQRVYPQAELTAGVIGYVDREHKGQAGIEFSQEKLLQAPPQTRSFSGDGDGFLLPDLAPVDPTDPASQYTLRLTLDTRLQRAARVALRQQMQTFNARRGTVIVLDVRDGSLLSLVSEPSFDPNHFYKADSSLFRNWAVADLYEPGSTFKPINVAIALEKGVIQPDSSLYDEGRIFVGGWPIQNADFTVSGGRGVLSIAQVLSYSSNVAMVHLMSRVRPSDYFNYLQRLGLGKGTGTDLAFETPGQMKSREQFVHYPIEAATTAFGQGFSLTPLQLAQLTASIANGGKLVTPHGIDGLYNRSSKKVKAPALAPPKQVFSPQVTQEVLDMMGDVVASGTGKGAQIPGYRLGGKTGTAQKAIGGTYSNQRITSFIGIFPLKNPRYVILAVVDEPQGSNAYGSTVAVPIVKTVTESLITLMGIPPSHPQELQRPPAPRPQ